jgi:hypothetical protein
MQAIEADFNNDDFRDIPFPVQTAPRNFSVV